MVWVTGVCNKRTPDGPPRPLLGEVPFLRVIGADRRIAFESYTDEPIVIKPIVIKPIVIISCNCLKGTLGNPYASALLFSAGYSHLQRNA
ncbi:hypothetical protein NBG4_1070008 [Candidatus Sulfobium mesophilum]|uniref:Uncharacterized protein n=1 Tax=Candidatus Sulfobium mesophilum TaxID=2016548 RepID=A0A2U3QE73_9BACT|nr:hypothetical protein NBG4_1070008 [Candidatus Sulfobium mesophilum]